MTENEKTKNTPALRFKGFTDDWEQRKLGDITTSYSGGTPTAGKSEYYGGDIPFIRSGEISSDHTELFLTEEGLNNSSATMVKVGDILYALYGATSGEVSISRLNGAINQAILAIIPNQGYDANFIMQWLQNNKSSIISTYLQGGQGNLSATIVKQLQIDLPSYEEQEQIGQFFYSLNKTITLHQKEVSSLQIVKKSMLEKMFPKEGAKVPEIRFSGFTDDWEQRKLGDVAKFINGRAYAQNELLPSGKYKVLRVGNFYTNDSWYYSDLELDNKYYANDGDLLYTWSATFGPHIWRGDRVIYHYHIWKIDLTDELEEHFAVQLLERDKDEILSGHNGSTMAHITKDGMEQKEVIIPKSIEEQRQLGLFFERLDNLITLHQKEADKFTIFKKSLLTGMFPK